MGLRFREKRKCLGGDRACFCRERSKEMRSDFALDLFKENASRWIEDLLRFCQALILDKWIYRGAVENLSTTKCLNGSRIYWPNRNFLDGSRICREAIETKSRKLRWIEDALRSVEKKKSKGLDRLLFVKKSLSLIKTVFQREEKHRDKCNQASYSTKYPNNILSFQKHLSKRKMQSI